MPNQLFTGSNFKAASATIAWVRQAKAETTGTPATISPALTSVTAGNFIYLSCQYAGVATAPTSVTDSSGDTVTSVHAQAWGPASGYGSNAYYVKNATAGTHTMTVTLAAGSSFPSCIIAEYSGASTTSPIDGTPNGTVGTGVTMDCSGYATAASNAGVITIFGAADNTAYGTGGNSFTHESPDANGTGINAALYDRLNVAASTYTPEATGPSASHWVCNSVAIK